ncbi:PREDICTED: metal transporter CNNM4 [Cyphomyrmex costatus]|uniref:Metal transporter CNNM2 n=1 Tax=Cyphomyrmex costatus TaxID=456900 RepID=A0A195C5G0_9HYME|nr:PREDICTED: metal transporter CNNM4 [Cyphomyrmex costatus]KYM96089.1 Metal transporter CNNM2 [Cyphomyrmex costatus]
MAQYVGCSRFAPATILLLFVPAYVVQLANAGASTSIPLTTTATNVVIVADAVRHDGVALPRVVQPTVNSAAVVSRSSLPFGTNSADDRQLPHVEFLGTGLDRDLALRWSLSSRDCPRDTADTLDAVWTSSAGDRAIYRFRTVPDAKITAVYFCLRDGGDEKWSNLGNHVFIKYPVRPEKYLRAQHDFPFNYTADIHIEGLRIDTADKEPSHNEKGIPKILAGTKAVIRLFGTGITEDTLIAFTDVPAERGSICDKIKSNEFPVENVEASTATIRVILPMGSSFYICAKRPLYEKEELDKDIVLYRHQGTALYNTISTYEKLLPLWLVIMIILTCLSLSALFSGLNLGLMAIDRTELKILCNTGTEKEKRYARTIQPVRNHGNYLLCSILFSNVLVNSIFTILLDELTSGIVAVICSTLAIVIFGEISPQAICSRHGLCVGAKTIYLTKLTMLITFPLSYPISKFLDFILGEEIGNVYNRERLKELVKVTTEYNDLEKDEVNIIAGALELRKKTVVDVMTRIEDVYMLNYNAILDFETVSEIMKSGFSRIPVYEDVRTNIVTMLYIKDLAFVDPDDNTPLKTLCQFYQNPCNFIFEDVTLDIMFKQFKEGHKGHMAFVQRVNNEGEGDPFYEVIGLITLEDVIEELIQAEIIDETDVFTDNRSKRKRQVRPKMPTDFTIFAEKKENQRIHISPQLTLAMFQYLSTTVDTFKSDVISETILRRLLKQDIIYHIKVKSREKAKTDPAAIIYQQGKAVDYFVLILEGRVEVTVGKENMMFESGPFTYFGSQALTANIGIAESPTNANPQTVGSIQSVNLDSMLRHTFIPDYTVRAVTEVFYVKVKRSLYLAAKRATLLERSQKDPLPSQEQFDDEVEKLLHSLEEDDRSVPESPILPADRMMNNEKGKDGVIHSPIRSVTAPTSPLPVSASPITNSKFISPRNDGKIRNSSAKVQTSPVENQAKRDSLNALDADVLIRQSEVTRMSPSMKKVNDEERTNLLPKQDNS